MKRFLTRLGLIGFAAAGAMGAGVAVSSAQCMPGTTDCAPLPQHVFRGHVDGGHIWRDGRAYRPEWRHHRDHRPDWRRHARRSQVIIDLWGGPFYDYWYVPQYRYTEPSPRYRVIHLSAAHIEWCLARYKTYRLSDNTYKPTKHTRRQCISPYS